jgi:hypothetical protein
MSRPVNAPFVPKISPSAALKIAAANGWEQAAD